MDYSISLNYIFGKDNRNYWMGLSIIWIILLHIYQNTNSNILSLIGGHGGRGVDIFFMLSTYGLCYSYENNKLGKFYRNRFVRLYPIYLIYLIVLFLIFSNHFSESPLLLAFLQVTGLASFRHVDVEWYIPALTCLYIFFPLLYKVCRYIYSKHWIISLLLVPISTILMTKYGQYLFFYHIPVRLVIIYITFLIYFCVSGTNTIRLLSICFVPLATYFVVDGLDFYSLSLLLPAIFLILSIIRPKLFFEKPINFIGKHTLEVYLSQSLAIQYFAKYNPYNLNSWLLYGCSFLFIILFSYFLYYSNNMWQVYDSVKSTLRKNE